MESQYIEINKDGDKFYYKDREMKTVHRADGPAIEYADGTKCWCIDGQYLSKKEFNELTAPEIVLTLDEIAAKFGIHVSKLKIVKEH